MKFEHGGISMLWNSSTTAEGTSTTAVQHTITVNVHMHISLANRNKGPKSSANASGQTNGNFFTPHMNNLNKGVSFTHKNTEKSDFEIYKSSLPTQKGFSKCSCIFPSH
eukprot:2083620-Ditylum_brightwellii.AAC.1